MRDVKLNRLATQLTQMSGVMHCEGTTVPLSEADVLYSVATWKCGLRVPNILILLREARNLVEMLALNVRN